jgi:hypothetical protein
VVTASGPARRRRGLLRAALAEVSIRCGLAHRRLTDQGAVGRRDDHRSIAMTKMRADQAGVAFECEWRSPPRCRTKNGGGRAPPPSIGCSGPPGYAGITATIRCVRGSTMRISSPTRTYS